jgi:small basic protein
MWIAFLALIIGFFAVYLPSLKISTLTGISEYIGVALIAGLDSIIGAFRSYIEGKFDDRVFVTGFFTNAILSALLLYLLGTKLQISYISVAIMVALFIRIFNNLGFVRRYLVTKYFSKNSDTENHISES